MIGLAVAFYISKWPYSWFEQWRIPGYIGLCILLLVPLALGTTTRGIAGWIDIGTLFSVQPSQLAIPIIAVTVGWLIHNKPPTTWVNLLTLLGIITVPAALIVIEPDLGTTAIYFITMGMLLFLSPVKTSHIVTLLSGFIIVVCVAWNFGLQDYQKQRITSFVGVTNDPQGAGYNARQSLIAVGSGQLWGRGLGQGVQSHLRFLPERQTDFIFASLAEELGFIGSVLVVLMYCIIVALCFNGFWYSPSVSGRYFCLAIGVMTAVQAGVNIGMNMGLFPITGITLPLLSYGGSSLLTVAASYGVVIGQLARIPRNNNTHIT
jgi:rod shape determining protein RodA